MSGKLGTRIRERRQELGMSLARLGDAVDCARSYLSLIETAKKPPPNEDLVIAIEQALMLPPGELVELARLERTPGSIRQRLESFESRDRRLQDLLKAGDLDQALRDGTLRSLIEHPDAETSPERVALPLEVPLINSVAAGYPSEFTDLGYPARIADEYVRCPDLADPDAFAARVVGDSMSPRYLEGDIVIFSPARDASEGKDCFCRLEPDHASTFKRVFFERNQVGEELIRLQPINTSYPPKVLPREGVAGLYPAVSVMRMVG